ncbi:MAG: protein translocase subunit SecD [Candidatus Paceibacterota bacterium]
MTKTRFWAIILLLVGVSIGYFNYYSEVNPQWSFYRPFKLGLDLSGGSRLTYEADVSKLNPADVADAMSSLREVIERRVNVFGVSEPLVQTESSAMSGTVQNRLVVELPGVTDVKEAAKMIAATPQLEFRVLKPGVTPETASSSDFIATGLTGRFLKRSQVSFNENSLSPSISIEFNAEGAKLFAEITKANINKPVAILLDNQIISAPNVREEIRDGKAEISGQFTVEEAKNLVRDLNLGALPVPVKLASTQVVGATLGSEAAKKGVEAGLIGLLIIAVFMITWYRLPGLVAVVSLTIYTMIMLAIFKLMPVTLTAAGMAGFILSIGIAVDANVLIFERMREELLDGKGLGDAVREGFHRAWSSIRDSNLSGIISSVILFWFGTSMIKGFALTLALGIIVSMFTAITVTRTLLLALGFRNRVGITKFLFGSAFFKH